MLFSNSGVILLWCSTVGYPSDSLASCITARCYAERSIAAASRPSVCLSVRLSVTLRYCDYTVWKSSKIISRLVNLGCSLTEIAIWQILCVTLTYTAEAYVLVYLYRFILLFVLMCGLFHSLAAHLEHVKTRVFDIVLIDFYWHLQLRTLSLWTNLEHWVTLTFDLAFR